MVSVLKRHKDTIKYLNRYSCVFLVLILCFVMIGTLSGCAFIDTITRGASDRTAENTQIIDDFIHGNDVDIGLKFDTPSAEDVINGEYGAYEDNGSYGYYDEKSGQYVSKTQYNFNAFCDRLKAFWIPACIVMILIGFPIRRLNRSSATIRRIGLLLEVILPVILTVIVYVVCAIADSSVVNLFDNLF